MAKSTTLNLDKIEQKKIDEYFMGKAILEAKLAYKKGEVPIGAVIEYKGKLFSKAHNRRIKDKSSLSHAEILAIEKACKKLGDWRLEDMTIYASCEPCLMCMGAIIHSRIKRLVYGCHEPKMGAVSSNYKVLGNKKAHHKVKLSSGVLEHESKKIIQDFFRELRKKAPLYIT